LGWWIGEVTEDRYQTTENRGQRTEDREHKVSILDLELRILDLQNGEQQRTADRRQTTEDG
jgi:hypothetical protein